MMRTKLFERLCQPAILHEAWMNVKSKDSAGGVDGMSVKDFEEKSDKYLSEILKDLKSGTWSPNPYMGISIPKKENERRHIGLLSIKDKIVQTAIKTPLRDPIYSRYLITKSETWLSEIHLRK